MHAQTKVVLELHYCIKHKDKAAHLCFQDDPVQHSGACSVSAMATTVKVTQVLFSVVGVIAVSCTQWDTETQSCCYIQLMLIDDIHLREVRVSR